MKVINSPPGSRHYTLIARPVKRFRSQAARERYVTGQVEVPAAGQLGVSTRVPIRQPVAGHGKRPSTNRDACNGKALSRCFRAERFSCHRRERGLHLLLEYGR